MASFSHLSQAISRPRGGAGVGRSKYLAAALENLQPTAQQPIRSAPEAVLKLMATAILGNSMKKEDAAQQARIAQAWDTVKPLIGGGYQDGPAMAAAPPPMPIAPPEVNMNAGAEQPREPAPASPKSQLEYTPPQKVGPVPIGDPRWGDAVMQLQQAGIDPGSILEWGKAARPQINIGPGGVPYDEHDPSVLGRQFRNPTAIANTVVDLNNPQNENRVIPEAPVKGAMPVYDNRGRVTDWSMPGGAQGVIGEAAAAQARGAAVGSSPYEFITTQDASGHPVTAAKSQASGQTFVGQSPAEQAAATAMATAGAGGRVNAPSQLAGAQQSLDLIDRLLTDPNLKDRVGVMGRLPAIPGTHGVAIDAMHDQLKGKVFLQAYGELKGGGAISEIEGQKAESAIARLNRAQSMEDYVDALKDLRSVVSGGMERIHQRANLGPGGGQPSAGVLPPAQRQAGQTYPTPRGPMTWTGTGWLPAN